MSMIKFFESFKVFQGAKLLIFIDQALFAFFNFGSIFLLSKLASINVFSSYVIFLSYINFAFIFSTFFLSAPILVLLPKKWKDHQRVYIIHILLNNILFNLILSGIIYFFIIANGESINPLFLFLAPLLMSTFDILKKYLFSSFNLPLIYAVISTIVLNSVFFLTIFFFINKLNFSLIISILLYSFLAANICLFIALSYYKVFVFQSNEIKVRGKHIYKTIIAEHYNYSKWIIIGGIAFWGYSQGLYILSKKIGINDFGIGKVRTIQNILGVLNIFIISVENYYTPYFANYIKNNSVKKLTVLLKDFYKKYYIKVILLILSVFVFTLVFYGFLFEAKYGSGLSLIIIFSLVQLLMFFIRPISISLKAVEVTFPFFIAHIFGFIVMIIFGYFFIKTFGYIGMALSFLLSNIAYSIILLFFYIVKIVKN